MTLQVKEIAMTKWTQCRNANFVVTKNASRAFEKHEELLNRNFWTFCTTEIGIITPCLQNHYDFFLWKVNLQKELNLTKQNQPDRNEILFLAKWINWNDNSLGVGAKFMSAMYICRVKSKLFQKMWSSPKTLRNIWYN